ncbi:hypothetical protein CDL15_Pgr006604 [Punica granatum]|uniref:Uncharacterized protein n=1 Tax=Punica granatum TaxID=22663 RepID=A0A218X6K8_PUNGR|nr:hypothetical protein CDL15_Pgr006604 [Punica granatum]PKI51690.1 hypothetical protein CRG98_027930 [Punica granatum]
MAPTAAMLTLPHHSPADVPGAGQSAAPHSHHVLSLFFGNWMMMGLGHEQETRDSSRSPPSSSNSVSSESLLAQRFDEALKLSCWSS